MLLRPEIVEEAGVMHQELTDLFDELLKRYSKPTEETIECVLRYMKHTRTERCWTEYNHIYNRYLMLAKGWKELGYETVPR